VIEESQTATSRWRATLIACVFIFLALLAVFWQTARDMVVIWYRSDTFAHGFLILPISLWLIWHKRKHLVVLTPQPTAGFLVLVAGALFVWALARLTGVLVVEQLAFIAVLVSGLASILGWQVSKFLAFPLLFLFFAVPMGEDLVPPMMEFTATFTVEALKLTGIPVYREGLWFSLPSGNWSVVDACSGVRYLIAAATLGVMYAYITYHTLWKRLLFIALSVIVPILANGVRAYMIVMIGHLSGMKYATGVDHLIYGWVFFGLVMFILFWIGSFWQEEEEPPSFVAPPRMMGAQSVGMRVMLISLLTIGASASTVWGTYQALSLDVQMAGPLNLPAGSEAWTPTAKPAAWSASHQATPYKIEARYRDGDDEVQLHLILFPQQRQGAEAINRDNRIVENQRRQNRLGTAEVVTADSRFTVNRSKVIVPVDGRPQEYLVWQWYRLAGRDLTNRYEGKAWEALARIYPGRADGAWIAIATALEDADSAAAEERLARFASSTAPGIGKSIDRALGLAD
jgi:exosortase A